MINIGEYEISVMENGNFWIARSDGEGMEVSKEKLEKLINDFHVETF